MRKYMFDTVVFNRILDGAIQLSALTDRIEVHATHVQRDEIEQTTYPNRRTALMQIFHDVVCASQSTASFVLGASRLGEARLGGERIVPTPSAVYGVSEYGQANYTQNNVQDALIAETAIKADHVLITDDRDLQTVTTQFGGRCLSVAELMAELGSP